VEEWRLEAVGYGAARPIAPNDNNASMARNRRIEFVVRRQH
jgi:outer membrane protein OmpA-like peptidoglycan-associated protein